VWCRVLTVLNTEYWRGAGDDSLPFLHVRLHEEDRKVLALLSLKVISRLPNAPSVHRTSSISSHNSPTVFLLQTNTRASLTCNFLCKLQINYSPLQGSYRH